MHGCMYVIKKYLQIQEIGIVEEQINFGENQRSMLKAMCTSYKTNHFSSPVANKCSFILILASRRPFS